VLSIIFTVLAGGWVGSAAVLVVNGLIVRKAACTLAVTRPLLAALSTNAPLLDAGVPQGLLASIEVNRAPGPPGRLEVPGLREGVQACRRPFLDSGLLACAGKVYHSFDHPGNPA